MNASRLAWRRAKPGGPFTSASHARTNSCGVLAPDAQGDDVRFRRADRGGDGRPLRRQAADHGEDGDGREAEADLVHQPFLSEIISSTSSRSFARRSSSRAMTGTPRMLMRTRARSTNMTESFSTTRLRFDTTSAFRSRARSASPTPVRNVVSSALESASKGVGIQPHVQPARCGIQERWHALFQEFAKGPAGKDRDTEPRVDHAVLQGSGPAPLPDDERRCLEDPRDLEELVRRLLVERIHVLQDLDDQEGVVAPRDEVEAQSSFAVRAGQEEPGLCEAAPRLLQHAIALHLSFIVWTSI